MSTMRGTLATACLLCLFRLPGYSGSREYVGNAGGDQAGVTGRQLLGVASGMKSPMWPGAAQQSRILVYGLR